MDAELDVPPIDRTSHGLTINIHLHLTNASHRWSLISTYFAVISIVFIISVFVAIWQVVISRPLRASTSMPHSESWSHRTSEGGGSFYGGSDREEMEMHEVETEDMRRREAELEFLNRLTERAKSD